VSGPLAGVRVVDCADRSGALCGRLLAGLGADVVLVEPPDGHDTRRLPPFWDGAPDPERSLFFWFYAAGKRSVRLDATTPDGAARLARLVAAADVVVETGPPGAWTLRHPRLVVASITPFGQRGPWARWRASDTVAQAAGGMLYVNGSPDAPPLRALGCQAYHQAGVLAAVGVLAALLARDATGRGQDVDVSLQAAVTGSLEHVPGLFHQDGRVARRQGTLHWSRHFRVARCRDGWALLCTLGDWTSLFEWMRADGFGDELADARFAEPSVRQAEAETCFAALDRWVAGYHVQELYEGAQLRRLPFAVVRAPAALLHDPHLAARGFFVPIEHPDLPALVPYPGAPFRVGHWPWRVQRPPHCGEHDLRVDAEWAAASHMANAKLE
jgi:benzylsuccinate CoA-transferase BbsE subunit